MPMRPPTLRPRGAPEGGRAAARREYDRERRQARPWRRWYNLAAWKRRRAEQLAREPLCKMCLAEGRTTVATVADHREPHRGDWDRFIGGALDSLCKPHHDGKKQREERAAGGRVES